MHCVCLASIGDVTFGLELARQVQHLDRHHMMQQSRDVWLHDSKKKHVNDVTHPNTQCGFEDQLHHVMLRTVLCYVTSIPCQSCYTHTSLATPVTTESTQW